MSNNAAVAAAQRRRAGPQNDTAPPGSNTKIEDSQRGPDAGRTLGLSDVLGLQSRQLGYLKGYQIDNEKHWEANDEFLHQLSEKVDELSEQQGTPEDGTSDTMLSRIGALEKEVAQLHGIVASLQDELIQKTS